VAAYSVRLKRSAAKEVEALSTAPLRRRVVAMIAKLAETPRPRGGEKLAGFADRYRLRQGSYRILYLIDDGDRLVTIFRVAHRRDAYRARN